MVGDSDREFIARPTDLFREYLERVTGVHAHSFLQGRLAMAMECITVVRALEDLPVADEGVKAAACSAFETLLVDQGLMDAALLLYETLGEWRRPKFVAVASEEELALWPSGADVADGLAPRDRSLDAGASPPDGTAAEVELGDTTDAWPREHHDPDAFSKLWLGVTPAEARGETYSDGSK